MDALAKPLCFTSPRLFALWTHSNQHCGKGTCASVCNDCLPSYQLHMKRQGRCEHPEVGFTFEGESIVGMA